MENQQHDPAAQPNDTEGTDGGIKALEALVAQARLEQGIKPGSKPTQITAAMPARELTPDELASREEDARRLALAEQKARRQGMFAVLCDRVGERYARCNFGSFKVTNERQKAAVDACREYAVSLPERIFNTTNLVLYGPVGTGKDHLAFAVCAVAILSHGKTVGWINGQEWFGQIRDEMDEPGLSERLLIMRLTAPDILVMSDPLPPIGSLTQHQSTMLYRLIDARYKAGKPTIVTVNVQTPDEADTRLGVPTWDRIRHDAWEIFCNWQSYRKPARIVNAK